MVKYYRSPQGTETFQGQREDILGELSVDITHLKIQTQQLDEGL